MDPDNFLESLDSAEDIGATPDAQLPESEPVQAEPEIPDTTPPQDPAPERVTRTIAPAPAGIPIIDPRQRTAEAAETPPQDGGQRVPLASLLEERAQWKRENEALQARLAALEAKAPAPAPAAAAPEAAEPPAPAPEWVEDPKGYVDAQVKAAIQKLEQTQNLTQQQQEQLAEMKLTAAVQAAEVEAAQKMPDWQGALTHLRTIRYQELALAFPEATDQQILATITNEERQVAVAQLSKGRNPYDYAYQLAKLRGYTPAATPAPAGGSAPNGQAPRVPVPPQPEGGTPVLDPSVNLNQVGGAPSDEEDTDPDDDGGLLEAAKAERFQTRRRA